MHGRLEPFSLLLVGVIFNTFWSALILLVNSVVNLYQTRSILFWLVGSLEAPTYYEVAAVAVFGAAGLLWLLWHARDMNLLSLGDESARDLGVDVDRVRRSIFIATSLMIGAAVSVSGMIGFVGLIVPHMLRLAFGADHRLLLPASAVAGAIFLVAADLAARVLIAPAELPVGVITALCGGPFFHLSAAPRGPSGNRRMSATKAVMLQRTRRDHRISRARSLTRHFAGGRRWGDVGCGGPQWRGKIDPAQGPGGSAGAVAGRGGAERPSAAKTTIAAPWPGDWRRWARKAVRRSPLPSWRWF